MALALLASAAVHGMVLSTHFVHVNPHLFEDPNLPMEVVLVNAKTAESPLNPDALAQVNLAGGGNTDEDRRLKSPLPASPRSQTGSEEAALQAKVTALEQQAKTLLSQLKTDGQVPNPTSTEAPSTAQPTLDASELDSQAREMAQLQARISLLSSAQTCANTHLRATWKTGSPRSSASATSIIPKRRAARAYTAA